MRPVVDLNGGRQRAFRHIECAREANLLARLDVNQVFTAADGHGVIIGLARQVWTPMLAVPMSTLVTVNAKLPSRTSWFSDTVLCELGTELSQPVTEVVIASAVTAGEPMRRRQTEPQIPSAGVVPTQHS
jgi:hypothetical protein